MNTGRRGSIFAEDLKNPYKSLLRVRDLYSRVSLRDLSVNGNHRNPGRYPGYFPGITTNYNLFRIGPPRSLYAPDSQVAITGYDSIYQPCNFRDTDADLFFHPDTPLCERPGDQRFPTSLTLILSSSRLS